jgi:hypothetical protein
MVNARRLDGLEEGRRAAGMKYSHVLTERVLFT